MRQALCLGLHLCCRIFGAERPATGDAFALVVPHVSAAAMSVFRTEFALTIAPGRRVVMVLDQARSHGAKALVVPDTITLVLLPPQCSDLDPVERVWLYLRGRFLSHRRGSLILTPS